MCSQNLLSLSAKSLLSFKVEVDRFSFLAAEPRASDANVCCSVLTSSNHDRANFRLREVRAEPAREAIEKLESIVISRDHFADHQVRPFKVSFSIKRRKKFSRHLVLREIDTWCVFSAVNHITHFLKHKSSRGPFRAFPSAVVRGDGSDCFDIYGPVISNAAVARKRIN